MRVRHKASGGERDTGVVAGAFFSSLNIFFLILLPLENRINIGARGTRVAHFTYCDVFVRRRALYVNI